MKKLSIEIFGIVSQVDSVGICIWATQTLDRQAGVLLK